MKDWKNIVSSIIGLIMGIAGALYGCIEGGIIMPTWVKTACIVTIAVGGAVIAWLQGRNADLTKKTKAQLRKQALEKDNIE